MVKPKKISAQGQFLTLFIVCFAILAYSFPRLSGLLVYDRQAILSGELWRLLTAPLVHFSVSHVFWDVAVFGLAGFAINASEYRRFWLVCSFTAFIPNLIFILMLPELERFGGLSGLATGAVAYFCLCSAFKTKKNRVLWLLILLFIGTKIIIEATIGTPIFVQSDNMPFRVLPSVHIIGFLVACATFLWPWPNQAVHLTARAESF